MHRIAGLLSFAALILACAGGSPDQPPAQDASGPAPDAASSSGAAANGAPSNDAKAGCQLAAVALKASYRIAPIERVGSDGTCEVESRGELRRGVEVDAVLMGAFNGWASVDGMAADGMDGSQFGRSRGAATCRLRSSWVLVDEETFETKDHRTEVKCGPDAAVR